MRRGSPATFVPLLSLLALAAPTHAALLAVGSYLGTNTSPPALLHDGVLIQAINFGGPSLIYDGIAFVGESVTPGSSNELLTATPLSVRAISTGGTQSNATVGSGPHASLFETEIFSMNHPNPHVLLIEGMDPNKIYRFQFLHGDTRDATRYADTDQRYLDSLGNVLAVPLSFGGPPGMPDGYVNQVIEVSGSTHLRAESLYAPGRGPSYSGLVVHERIGVPEPGVLALLGLGIAGLRCTRRQNR